MATSSQTPSEKPRPSLPVVVSGEARELLAAAVAETGPEQKATKPEAAAKPLKALPPLTGPVYFSGGEVRFYAL